MISITLPIMAYGSDNKSTSEPITLIKDGDLTIPLHVEAGLEVSTPYKGNLPFGAVVDLNYQIKRFSIHALIDGTYFLPKENVTKDYNKTFNLGGGIGFELFPAEGNDRNVFEVRASVTRSLGAAEYRNTAYKVGLQWVVKTHKRALTPSIGVGYSLRDFSNIDFHAYHGMYISLGIRF